MRRARFWIVVDWVIIGAFTVGGLALIVAGFHFQYWPFAVIGLANLGIAWLARRFIQAWQALIRLHEEDHDGRPRLPG